MFKTTVAAAAFAASSLFGSIAHAANIDLAFIMDASGSVQSGNFDTAMDSLADALAASIPVGGADTYRIGVVTFSNTAKLTTLKTINVQDDLDMVVKAIRDETFIGSTTNYKAAFDLTRTSFGALGNSSIVNMMTDGEPCCGSSANSDAITGRNALKGAGWDSLSFESVEGTGGADNTFLRRLGFDTIRDGGVKLIDDPADINDPLNEAFVLKVSSFGSAYDAAIKAKVQKIVDPDPIPVPAALPLLAGGLALFGFVGRRRRAAA
ncbi:MAG: vWA domain-containing protein [Arenibacterium sp.]